ncbi:hypothetical protein SLA2020_505200 [Shorea laevis]
MATFLQAPMACSIRYSSSLSESVRRTSRLKFDCRAFAANNSAKIPLPPVNPKDPFLSRLTSAAASSPEALVNRPRDSDAPPFLDLFDSPRLMASPAQVERSVSYDEGRPRSPPPDLPSLLLDEGIVYIGMPLVPAVTELVIAQLIYLQWKDPKAPIYLYLNSTGTARDDGVTVGRETDGFAIYDSLMHVKNEIRTVCIGAAVGQSCLLLAAGTKGKRSMLPHATVAIHQPRVPSSGLMQASDVLIHVKETITNRDTLVELLAKHTGNSVETVANKMKRRFYMDAVTAREFGVIDTILWRGQENLKAVIEPDVLADDPSFEIVHGN